jgi:hypothetical protein
MTSRNIFIRDLPNDILDHILVETYRIFTLLESQFPFWLRLTRTSCYQILQQMKTMSSEKLGFSFPTTIIIESEFSLLSVTMHY